MKGIFSKIALFASTRAFRLIFAFAISAIILTWLYLVTNWSEVWRELQRVDASAFIPSSIVIILHFFIRALRWRFLLPRLNNQPTIFILFKCLMLGNFATFILPLRAGEFVRPLVLAKFSDHSFSTGFASVVVERFFDLATVLISFALVVNYVPGVPDMAIKGAYALGGLAVCIFVFIALGSAFPIFIKNLNYRVTSFLPTKISDLIRKFLDDLLKAVVVLRNPLNLLLVTLLTSLVWISGYYVFYEFFSLFQIESTYWLAVTVGVLVALAVAAPSAPGFVGVYQAGCIAGFSLFGISNEIGVAYSIITHLFQFVIFLVIALVILVTHNLRFTDITK